jgi:hypothetical protein
MKASHWILLIIVCICFSSPLIAQVHLPGFETGPFDREQVKTIHFKPEVRVWINAPAPKTLSPYRPFRLILFALPNGNTIEQTHGRQMVEGLDWHYDIQHIGAQTRLLRQTLTEENIVTAYLEAESKSWPGWRKKFPEHEKLIADLIAEITAPFADYDYTIHLSSHSGGGSFITGFINSVDHIPSRVKRISYLDSNYSYSNDQRHGDKLIEWLQRVPDAALSVIAYDDREITFNGRKVVGPTGGAWRATLERMLPRFQKELEMEKTEEGELIFYRGLAGRVEFILNKNPENKILHTVLVERNGLLHAMTFDRLPENRVWTFWGARAYEPWIEEGGEEVSSK